MDAIDADRFQGLVTALRNAIDSSPAFSLLQDAQGRWARARADLEDFQTRGPVGRRDVRNPDLNAAFQRGVAELEARLAEADREVKRIDALQRQSAAQRRTLQQLVDGVRAWARDNSVKLPGEDDDVHDMTGFAASTVRIPTPSSTARSWP
jgi:hypothetical protein